MVRTNLRIWHWRLLDTSGRDWKNWGITLGETRGDYGKTRQTHFLWGQSAHSLARSCNSCYIVVFLPFNMLGWCMDMRKYRDQYRIRTPNQESATKSIRNRQQYITVHGLWLEDSTAEIGWDGRVRKLWSTIGKQYLRGSGEEAVSAVQI